MQGMKLNIKVKYPIKVKWTTIKTSAGSMVVRSFPAYVCGCGNTGRCDICKANEVTQ